MAAQSPLGSRKAVQVLHFSKTNIANANGTLQTLQADNDEYVMPVAGAIIGFTGALNATLTTGSLVFQPTINGSLCPALPDAASLRTNQQRSNYMQDAWRNNYIFSAGQRLGVMWRKADTVNPTTADAACLLVVLLDQVEY